MAQRRIPTAIDLYAGVGGWALGLNMAGISVVRSYEWWSEAADTHSANIGGDVTVTDIRSLPLSAFPSGVDFVVGSPPCTQFSFSNRGGNGDIADGLRDIEKFLQVVEHVRPRAWAMENVPRVAGILRQELVPGGTLERYAHLVKVIEVVDASNWGVPQRRRRMLAGTSDLELLHAYRSLWSTVKLGDVVAGLAGGVDPVYGWPCPRLTDNLREQPLTDEELRMNRDQKTYHRIYNVMQFPERLDRPSRTVTALCTRVSRESLILHEQGGYYRPSIREKASLQSFPAHYQFYGTRYVSRAKMVGNAIPPLLTFNIAHALLGSPAGRVVLPNAAPVLANPEVWPTSAQPDEPRRRHTQTRAFAAAIPGLRFGSGTRFELKNCFTDNSVHWEVAFGYGTSTAIRAAELREATLDRIHSGLSSDLGDWLVKVEHETRSSLAGFTENAKELQRTWVRGAMQSGPFALTDTLGEVAGLAVDWLPALSEEHIDRALVALLDNEATRLSQSMSWRKLTRHGKAILAGAVVASIFNRDSQLVIPQPISME